MANPLRLKLRGITESIFQIGVGGPQIKNNSGTLEARNAEDGAFVNMSGLDPTANEHFATKSYVDSTAGTSSSVKSIRFAVALVTASSVGTIAANARVRRTRLEIGTAYDAGTIAIGKSGGTVNLLMETGDNDPATANSAWEVHDDADWGAGASAVTATITGSPTVGDSVVFVEYVETPTV